MVKKKEIIFSVELNIGSNVPLVVFTADLEKRKAMLLFETYGSELRSFVFSPSQKSIAFLAGGGVVLFLVLLDLSAELLVTLTLLLTQDSGLVCFVLLVNRGAGESSQRRKDCKQNLRLKESQHGFTFQGR